MQQWHLQKQLNGFQRHELYQDQLKMYLNLKEFHAIDVSIVQSLRSIIKWWEIILVRITGDWKCQKTRPNVRFNYHSKKDYKSMFKLRKMRTRRWIWMRILIGKGRRNWSLKRQLLRWMRMNPMNMMIWDWWMHSSSKFDGMCVLKEWIWRNV